MLSGGRCVCWFSAAQPCADCTAVCLAVYCVQDSIPRGVIEVWQLPRLCVCTLTALRVAGLTDRRPPQQTGSRRTAASRPFSSPQVSAWVQHAATHHRPRPLHTVPRPRPCSQKHTLLMCCLLRVCCLVQPPFATQLPSPPLHVSTHTHACMRSGQEVPVHQGC